MGRHEDHERSRAAAATVCRTLQKAGHTAYFAGGCVRDELLGLDPTDHDVATDATPDRIRDLFHNPSEVGASFGVMLVREDGVTVEVATFREETGYSDARRPDEVRFSTPERDAHRRDFTVNALFLDPVALDERAEHVGPVHGHVIDHVGGLVDLEKRLIRAVGNPSDRLAEDHLRALRGVRLACRLGFEIEPSTAGAILGHASELRGVSVERIGDEVRRMMAHRSRARAAGLIQSLGLDAPIFGAALPESRAETIGALDEDAGPVAALAAWAFDRHAQGALEDPDSIVRAWRRALNLSNEESRALAGTLSLASGFLAGFEHKPVAAKKRAGAAEFAGDALRLVSAIDPAQGLAIGRELESLAGDGVGLAPAPWITGERLIAMGFRPGRGFSALLDEAYNAQLDGSVATEEEAVSHAEARASAHGVDRA